MIDKQILEQLYFIEKLTTRKIAEKLNATPMQVFYAMKKYGMELRTNRPKNPLTKEVLEKLYLEDNLSHLQIAKKFGITINRVGHYFRKCGIKARPIHH